MSVMRPALIALSRNRALQDLIVRIPVSRRMARRFVAGETLADAIAAVLNLNNQGMLATLDHLGENVTSEAEAIAAADEYLLALEALNIAGAASNVSVKLTQMGLDLGEDFCYANVSRDRPQGGGVGQLRPGRYGGLAVHGTHAGDLSAPAQAVRQLRHRHPGLPAPQPGRCRGADR